MEYRLEIEVAKLELICDRMEKCAGSKGSTYGQPFILRSCEQTIEKIIKIYIREKLAPDLDLNPLSTSCCMGIKLHRIIYSGLNEEVIGYEREHRIEQLIALTRELQSTLAPVV